MSLPFGSATCAWFTGRFGTPTAPQADGWQAIARGEDTLIAAPTGSGKTLAAFLWCLDDLHRRAAAGPLEERTQVVYVSPLKALSHDIHVNLETPLYELGAAWGARGRITCGVRTGDTPARERAQMAKRPPHILVTTPESLYILLTTQRGQTTLAGVRTVIVDEIHAVADDRRGAHLSLSLERLDALVRSSGLPRPQRIGLSATQHPIELVGRFLTGGGPCTIVDSGHRRALDLDVLAPEGELAAVLSHEQWGNVYDQIAALARAHRTTIVFTNTRRLSERVAHALTERLGDGLVAAHHGALAREVRQAAEARLRTGELRVMVATASLELGIDVGAVELVCQLGTPRSIATLLQRVGRAGHQRLATPKGRLYALTRDDLLECAALVRALRANRLDALEVPDAPLDVLSQQLVAACATREWDVDELYALARRAFPFRALRREDYDAVLEMLAEGIATERGRSRAHLHRDRVGNKVRGRRGARLAAVLSGGSIPDRNDYEVVLDPEGRRIGTLDEDFAIESSAGDIIQLGNTSWKIRRVEAGRVRVEDAHGQPPTVPFWLGEAPSRTRELSEEVSRLREDLAERVGDRDSAARWLAGECALTVDLARQAVDYVAATRAALGAVPSQKRIVCERFFDEGGGMQLVLHAPFGGRINRAWGLALRKRFCVNFDFELQAAATDDGVLLSLSAQHSFPLETIADYVPPAQARKLLTQAALQAPVFETRWRWNVTRALAVLRHSGGKKLPAPIMRIRVGDLLAAVFPAQVGCQDNNPTGHIEPPDHPLVNQTLRDCLEEAMDLPGLEQVLGSIASGEIEWVCRETPEPSPMSHQLINANPWAYLDDAPLEERRTRAVSVRRGLPAVLQDSLGALDDSAVARVVEDTRPEPRDADELHDHLCVMGVVRELDAAWLGWAEALVAARRATRIVCGEARFWVAAEKLLAAHAVYPRLVMDPPIAPAPGTTAPDRETAVRALVRAHLEIAGPTTETAIADTLALDGGDVAIACGQLEAEGTILRGRFRSGVNENEWCQRGLLARIHRLTIGRLRREIEPVTPLEYRRFLHVWQHAAAGHELHGVPGLTTVLTQLEGFEAPVGAWETEILPARIAGYSPALLDELCLSGEFVWGRRSVPRSESPPTTRGTPIAFWRREAQAWMAGPGVAQPEGSAAARIEAALAARGALFQGELAAVTGLTPAELESGLWALVASGRATADGFGALRALGSDDPRVKRRAGRWSLLQPEAPDERAAEELARRLLVRWGVVVREACAREILPVAWRELLLVWRRLEARGEIRGGRFVAGFVGEQFALPEAVDTMRTLRRKPAPAPPVAPPRDPLHVRALCAPAELQAAAVDDSAPMTSATGG